MLAFGQDASTVFPHSQGRWVLDWHATRGTVGNAGETAASFPLRVELHRSWIRRVGRKRPFEFLSAIMVQNGIRSAIEYINWVFTHGFLALHTWYQFRQQFEFTAPVIPSGEWPIAIVGCLYGCVWGIATALFPFRSILDIKIPKLALLAGSSIHLLDSRYGCSGYGSLGWLLRKSSIESLHTSKDFAGNFMSGRNSA